VCGELKDLKDIESGKRELEYIEPGKKYAI